MTIGGSIFLIALGAILRYATNIHVKGVSIDTIGLILMLAGAAALILSFIHETMLLRARRNEVPEVEERREVREPPRY